MRAVPLALALLLLAFPANAELYNTAVLQTLDKVTARTTTIDVPIGATYDFGTLEIIPRACDKKPPEETPESAAFLDIYEKRPDEPVVGIFRGWMFASSPAISALEHPVYDVWVIDCKNSSASEPKASDEKPE